MDDGGEKEQSYPSRGAVIGVGLTAGAILLAGGAAMRPRTPHQGGGGSSVLVTSDAIIRSHHHSFQKGVNKETDKLVKEVVTELANKYNFDVEEGLQLVNKEL